MLAEYGVPFGDSADFAAFLVSDARFALGVAPLHEGFALREPHVAIVTETELYAASPRRLRGKQRERASNVEAMIRDLAELRIGDPVVHVEHGIGRYLGLQAMDLGDGPTEFLHLEYANEATLYVPVAQLHLIGRYSGADPAAAPLHQLGSGDWDKARRKAAKQVRDTAAELLNLYALRAARKGHAFEYRQHDYEAFAEGFGFEETPDQQAAIDAVLKDMSAGFPMDRLVCGDVGFGKTEVALRAAFAAVAGGRQVAVLCPTTLLAEQHCQTFRDRFSQWPVNIVELSRFRSTKEVSDAIAGMNAGTVDIVIGTHKLLSADVRFDRLGLVIIDEEHRFGVRQKERLKALRAEVDVLTLTATPIPRTLALSLEGIRDFSVIATAPQRRLAIKTFVRKESASLMREAVLRELKRGGQVYFLHNEVETIENRRARLAELLPEARIEIAHGQMHERDLERVMRDFYQQRFNVLLCTTIIETGIDVPTANTIIIHRADKFGLAQLHQLRGRVGRSHHQAYAYLMVPDEGGLTKNAEKRLEAIQNLEELGSGFYLAMHDLEIRGAGEVLGENQSGNMQEVGFDLYTQMLNAAVRALRSGREPDLMAPLAAVTEINLRVPALLPPDYVADVHQRLSMYKKLASCDDEDGLIRLQEELVDRYGKLPEQARALIETHRLRLVAERLGVKKIDASGDALVIQFVPNPPFDTARLIALMQRSKTMRLAGPERLRIDEKTPERRRPPAAAARNLQGTRLNAVVSRHDAGNYTPAPMKDLVIQGPALSSEALDTFKVVCAPERITVRGAAARCVGSADDLETRKAVRGLGEYWKLDWAFVEPAWHLADYRLLALDMDSTLINIESLDAVAAYAGKGEEVAAITEAAMRGELSDYKESLRRRVAMLAGVDVAFLARVYEEKLALNDGAERLVSSLPRRGPAHTAGHRWLHVLHRTHAAAGSDSTPPVPTNLKSWTAA